MQSPLIERPGGTGKQAAMGTKTTDIQEQIREIVFDVEAGQLGNL